MTPPTIAQLEAQIQQLQQQVTVLAADIKLLQAWQAATQKQSSLLLTK
jgi:prefoldin subunit 5